MPAARPAPGAGVADGLRLAKLDGTVQARQVHRRLTSRLAISENAPRSSSGLAPACVSRLNHHTFPPFEIRLFPCGNAP